MKLKYFEGEFGGARKLVQLSLFETRPIYYIKNKELIIYRKMALYQFLIAKVKKKYFGNRKRNHSKCAYKSRMSQENTEVEGYASQQRIEVIPSGKAVRSGINPVSRYSIAALQYNHICNMIQGIKLIVICCPCVFSWLYDLLIYFYALMFLIICCRNQTHNGRWIALFMFLFYVAILILPIISLIVLGLSAIFFLYFWAGVVVSCINRSRLGNHKFTERMVHEVNAPPFPGYVNEYFEFKKEKAMAYYSKNNKMSFYAELQTTHKGQFMAYKQEFLDNYYDYITSGRMICFHMTFMTISIIGAIISVSAFPSVYGRE